jgi:glucosamine-phosphate N-acetyltransferase
MSSAISWRGEGKTTGSGGRAAERYEIRELNDFDLERGFLDTLLALSDTGGLNPREARKIFLTIRRNPFHHILVAVASDGRVLGATTLLVEQKFIHNGSLVGHIEDVVVSKGEQGKGIGKAVVKAAVAKARDLGCYKCILNCKDELTGFYEKLGFRRSEVGMRIDLTPD